MSDRVKITLKTEDGHPHALDLRVGERAEVQGCSPGALWARVDAVEQAPALDVAHIDHQRRWSTATFGPGWRNGTIDHLGKELGEIADAVAEFGPSSGRTQEECVDALILAMDLCWRSGMEPAEIIAGVQAKQRENEGRSWPDWRLSSPDLAIEHDRSRERAGAMSHSTACMSLPLSEYAGDCEKCLAAQRMMRPPSARYDQCDATCTTDCGHCKGQGPLCTCPEDESGRLATYTCFPGAEPHAVGCPRWGIGADQ